jgi:hypothetical protein
MKYKSGPAFRHPLQYLYLLQKQSPLLFSRHVIIIIVEPVDSNINKTNSFESHPLHLCWNEQFNVFVMTWAFI